MTRVSSLTKLDWSSRGRARVFALMVLGTMVCIGVAFAVDSYDLASARWRWGADPINNLVIPLVLAPPFFFLLLEKMRELAVAHHELMTVAATDSLTSLLNRRAFTELVDGYLKLVEASEKQSGGALLVIDVDHFKSVNDRFGHAKGDEALKLIADAIRSTVRDTDLVGRVGGEEFCVFMHGQSPELAAEAAERIRAAVADTDFVPGEARYPLSISVGGVAFNGVSPFSDLYRSADAHLYQAKNNGRNRVEFRLHEAGGPYAIVH
ncbi:GGDEF domain-containing protein [Hyphomonas sp.]|uniref:GGDEF domain-containing protein n=1 Tax=Hyphomonas sp. TaxID=87 RepID=UPI0025C48ECC|nr:GGDEF domain-containing protein [Hyphomonas sp.]MBI1398625.1 diguanylate cyclase [Hyphomonas sp.]